MIGYMKALIAQLTQIYGEDPGPGTYPIVLKGRLDLVRLDEENKIHCGNFVPVDTRFRHRKRGSTYKVKSFSAMQCAGPLDGHPMVRYVAEDPTTPPQFKDNVRPAAEFFDGRFERLG